MPFSFFQGETQPTLREVYPNNFTSQVQNRVMDAFRFQRKAKGQKKGTKSDLRATQSFLRETHIPFGETRPTL